MAGLATVVYVRRMDTWAVIGASGLTGAFTLGGVALSGWWQSHVAGGETRERRKQEQERERLAVYRRFLIEVSQTERKFLDIAAQYGIRSWSYGNVRDRARREEVELRNHIQAMFAAFYAVLIDVYLAATPEVGETASELEHMILQMEVLLAAMPTHVEPVHKSGSEGAFSDENYELVSLWVRVYEAWSDLGGGAEWGNKLTEVINAMRSDVASELGALATLQRAAPAPDERPQPRTRDDLIT